MGAAACIFRGGMRLFFLWLEGSGRGSHQNAPGEDLTLYSPTA